MKKNILLFLLPFLFCNNFIQAQNGCGLPTVQEFAGSQIIDCPINLLCGGQCAPAIINGSFACDCLLESNGAQIASGLCVIVINSDATTCTDDGCAEIGGECNFDEYGACYCRLPPGETRNASNRLGDSFTTGILKKGGVDHIISVSRFNETLNRTWFKTYGSTGYNTGRGIATDIQGHNVTTGEMSNTVDFDTESFTSFGEHDIFIVKNDADGNEQWARQAGGTGVDAGLDVIIDDVGNSYVVGHYNATANFDGISLEHEGIGGNGFVAKYNPNGTIQWAIPISGSGDDQVKAITLSVDGHLYITGYFSGVTTLGDYTLNSEGGKSLFVAKLTEEGEILWAEKYEHEIADVIGSSLTTDIANNVIVAGVKNNQMLVLKYGGNNGQLLKEKYVQSTGEYFHLMDITSVDDNGNVQVIGHFTGDIVIDGELIENIGAQDVFLAEFTPNLDVVWARGEGGTSLDYGIGIDNEGTGYTSYVGCTFGTSTVGGITQEGDNIVYFRRFDDETETVSLETKNEFASLVVAPNPFSNAFNIEMNTSNNEDLTIDILDLTGKTLFTQNTSISKGTNSISVDVANKLSQGLYLLQITNEKGQRITRKITQL